MINQNDQVWNLLQKSGIVQGELPDCKASGSPWYIKVLLAFCGWLAAIFILGFIAAAFEFVFRNSGAAFTVGALIIVGAFFLLRIPANEFVEHLGLAASLAGQALIAYAIFDLHDQNEILTWLSLAVFQMILAASMPNFVHRVFSTLFASIALAMAFNKMNFPDVTCGALLLGASFCWLNEFRFPRQMTQIRAIGYGLVLALVVITSLDLFGYKAFGVRLPQNHVFWTQPWLGEIIIGAVAIYVVWSVLQRYGQAMGSRLSITTLLATLIVCVVSINVQGVTVGMVIVCLGFLGANRILLGLGIASLLFFISTYYYLLDSTLLEKSLSLLAVGVILLLVRLILRKLIPAHNEA